MRLAQVIVLLLLTPWLFAGAGLVMCHDVASGNVHMELAGPGHEDNCADDSDTDGQASDSAPADPDCVDTVISLESPTTLSHSKVPVPPLALVEPVALPKPPRWTPVSAASRNILAEGLRPPDIGDGLALRI